MHECPILVLWAFGNGENATILVEESSGENIIRYSMVWFSFTLVGEMQRTAAVGYILGRATRVRSVRMHGNS